MRALERLLLGAGISFLLTIPAIGDDGELLRRNVSSTPELETEFAAIRMLPLYVPAQNSGGTLLSEGVDYLKADGSLFETRSYVRPLIAHYTDGHVDAIEEDGYGGFPGHGKRDAYGAVSLDDGATWKRTNLSKSAELSSFSIKENKKWVPYPGDVGRTFAASDGNKVLIAWVSRYCGGGNPTYAVTDTERTALEAHFSNDTRINPFLYLDRDLFGVPGAQGSSDLADEGYPLVGELPFACVWTARGVIHPPADENATSTFTWFKAERLTSGVRDANRPEAVCVKGAGCVVTWQEDPEGIRPGEGEGPGEGWSGAIAHHQTDTWYSYISWDDFDSVADGSYGAILADYDWATAEGTPMAAIPFAMPVRLTDNAMCTVDGGDPYCRSDLNGNGIADFCADSVTVSIEVLDEGGNAVPHDVQMCISEDGRLLRGNTAATRARIGLHGYSSICAFDRTAPDACPITSAWFSMSYEENKGLGDEGEDETTAEDLIEKVDMGKNVWYHTFDMFQPEMVSQGLMLNQPAVYPEDFSNPEGFLTQDMSLGYNFYRIDPDPIYETQAGLATTLLYQSEIARRPSPISQDWYDAGPSGTVAFHLWKQGIIRRGGPADIMARRFVIPDEFDATLDNPYDYSNMACDNWAFTDGSNPRYVKGLCASAAINLSANTIVSGECGDAASCLAAFPINEYIDDFAGGTQVAKIWTWQQFGPGYAETPPDNSNLTDTSWANPYDVAKGHRGFLAGDMVMVMYAWSPNWMANTVGHDNYNLYVRRSFDGGLTWSTLPASFTHSDGLSYTGSGTTTCEWMGPAGTLTETQICTTYGAGEFEQARNVSQLVGTQVTILDPRYSPTTRSITPEWVSTSSLPGGFSAPGYADDTRDPSRFFIVYETGDNTTVAFGEAEPLDLFYSRAIDWGDHYLVWADEPAPDAFNNEFDALEGSQRAESGEASITASPGGQFFYAVWNQWDFDRKGKLIGSDAWFRRVLFLDESVEPSDPSGPGNPSPPKPKKK